MLRKIIFGFYNFISGGAIEKNTKQIEQINLRSNFEQIHFFQQNELKKLLESVCAFVPFYQNFKGADFTDLPVVNKNLINAQYASFISQKYQVKKLKKVSTSGSTGVPFVIYHNPEKVRRQIADTLFFNQLCGYEFGQKLIYLRIWNQINQLSFLQRIIKNVLPVNSAHLSLEYTQNLIDDMTRSGQIHSVLSYASSLEMLERNLKALNITKVSAKMSCIITMAEALPMNTRSTMEQVFGCPVFSRYSNSENGFIAHQIPGMGLEYLINNASFLVEFLAIDSDEPVADDQPGRIVVTDLFNEAFPLIRYDTGDIGVRKSIQVDGKSYVVIDRIEGRKLDFITNVAGQLVSPHVVDYSLRTIHGVDQFQLIQTQSTTYTLKLNVKNKAEHPQIQMEAIERLKSFLGDKAVFKIEFVREIPMLASGKRSIVVNQWNQK